jgi:hypothetical protein
LSNPENTKEVPLSEEQSTEEVREASLPEEKSVEEVKEAPKAPEPTATGNEKITILKHGIYIRSKERGEVEKEGVELSIRNVSDLTINSVLFEAVFYDEEGNILDTVEHKTTELRPNISRTFRITSSSPERDKIESYNVRLVKTTITPESTATGNEKITILKHFYSYYDPYKTGIPKAYCIELTVRNVSDSNIARAVFEVVLYDIEGNILDTFKHRENELKTNTSRAIVISYTKPKYKEVKGYNVKLVKTTTTDVEKVQLRRFEAKTTEAGEEVSGIVKNISAVKTDVALVATFNDRKKENIGTKVIIFRDTEPNSIKQFHFTFKLQEGDIVGSCAINVTCDIEE